MGLLSSADRERVDSVPRTNPGFEADKVFIPRPTYVSFLTRQRIPLLPQSPQYIAESLTSRRFPNCVLGSSAVLNPLGQGLRNDEGLIYAVAWG